MNTTPLLLSILFISLFGRGIANTTHQNADFTENLRYLSLSQLQDTANYYFEAGSYDTSLTVYTMITETPIKKNDIEQKKIIIDAYMNCGVIHHYMNEYEIAYDFFIKALDLCDDDSAYDEYKPTIHSNMGVIHAVFKRYDFATDCFLKSLDWCKDTVDMITALSNLGYLEYKMGKTDSALFSLNRALQLSKQHNNFRLDAITGGIATFYQNATQYDSAYYYYHLSLIESRKKNNIAGEISTLSDLGALFFEMNQLDSALRYINLSNTLATGNYFRHIVLKNYLLLSKIELAKGNIDKSLEYHLLSSHLNDSLFNASTLGNINQIQYDYDFAKINEQLEELRIELHEKKQTITYQLTFWMITMVILLAVIVGLLLLYRRKKKNHKQTTYPLSEKAQKELLHTILTFMENNLPIICDADFTIKKLSTAINSNRKYISYVINKHQNKNFRLFLNEYRIKEAKRLLSNPDAHIYTIETIANKAGFKSRDSFNKVFKEITGVNPAHYLKTASK